MELASPRVDRGSIDKQPQFCSQADRVRPVTITSVRKEKQMRRAFLLPEVNPVKLPEPKT